MYFGLPAKGTGRESLSIFVLLAGSPSWMSGPGQLSSLSRGGTMGIKVEGTATHQHLMTSELDFGPEGNALTF